MTKKASEDLRMMMAEFPATVNFACDGDCLQRFRSYLEDEVNIRRQEIIDRLRRLLIGDRDLLDKLCWAMHVAHAQWESGGWEMTKPQPREPS